MRKAALSLLEALLDAQMRLHGGLPDTALKHLAAFSAAASDTLVMPCQCSRGPAA